MYVTRGCYICSPSNGAFAGSFSAVWANDGGDKVTQDELRATNGGQSAVTNTVWNGTTISQFGAKNETVSFNLIMEAATAAASNVTVSLSNLVGPGGALIRCDQTRTTANLFNWTTTESELFFVRYLQVNCLSPFAFGTLTGGSFEPQVPSKMRLPLSGGVYTGTWTSRPNAGKFFPDIAVPLEVQQGFGVPAGGNQQVWVDVYIPKTAVAGLYTGTVTVTEGGVTTHTLPVQLTVRNFALPDKPSFNVMLYADYGDVALRYTGVEFPLPLGNAQDLLAEQVLSNQRYLAHRAGMSMIGDDGAFSNGAPLYPANPSPAYQPFVTGTAFTSANGYAGRGVSTGQNIYSVGTYGAWHNDPAWAPSQNPANATQATFQSRTTAWETWFEANTPSILRFVYLADESSNYSLVQQWANWMATNPGVGVNLPSFATVGAVVNVSGTYTPISSLEPSVNFICSSTSGLTSAWNSSIATIQGTAGHAAWRYNGARPFCPTMHTEEPGTDPRALPWNCFKKGVPVFYYWDVTYYDDTQSNNNGVPQANFFIEARTYAASQTPQPTKGTVYGNNGEGLLFFPGTDAVYPTYSYGIPGPISSLRLKHLRRGVQDFDYLTLASAINSSAVASIVSTMVPTALWETGVANPSDPTYYVNTPASWSEDPNVWEGARLQLANIIAPTLSFPLLGAYLIGGSVQTSLGQGAFQAQIATLGAAIVGTYPGWTGGGFTMNSAAAAIKAINPNVKLSVYTNIMELEPGVGSSGSPYSPVFNAATANNWFLRTSWPLGPITDADGLSQNGLNQTTFTQAGSGAYAGFANYLAWRASWSAANEVGGSNWDSLFLDNVFYQPRTSADYNQSGSSQTASAAATNWRNGYASYVPKLKAAITTGGSLVWANTADWGNGAITGYNQLFNGGVIESIMGQSYSPENSGWLNMMNNYYKVIMNAMTPGGFMIFEQDIAATSYAGIRYGICSCLLDNGYYFNNANGPGGGSTIHPTDESNFKLGGAIAGPNNPTNGTWSSGGIAVYQHGVYRRDFVNGPVLLNPRGNGPQNVTLERDAYYLRAVIDTDGINTALHVPAGTNIPLPDAATANIGGGGLIMSWTPT